MRKTITALLLLLVLCLALCACGGNGDGSSKDAAPSADASVEEILPSAEASADSSVGDTSVDDGKVEYSVTVTDAEGKGMAGVMVQLCLDSCMPGVTDANGVAKFNLEAADYKVSIMTMPEGYTYAVDANEYHFEEGSTSLTIALTAAE